MAPSAKRYRVRIQRDAIDDLDKIYRYLFRESPAQARIHVKKLQGKIRGLRDFPHRGSRAKLLEGPASSGEIRFIEYKGYLVFYTIAQRDVVILHIAGPGQNWINLFL